MVGAIALILLTAWGTTVLMGDGPERARDRPHLRPQRAPGRRAAARRAARLLRRAGRPRPSTPLPAEFRELLETTPVVISHLGREHRAYGHYMGDTVARDNFPDKIVIYRDTLERDFGHDPDLLRAQVERTLRHEVAHHLGWGESGRDGSWGCRRGRLAAKSEPGKEEPATCASAHEPGDDAARRSFAAARTEREGFEPSRQVSPPTRFPVALLKPLGHLSGCAKRVARAPGCRRALRRAAHVDLAAGGLRGLGVRPADGLQRRRRSPRSAAR